MIQKYAFKDINTEKSFFRSVSSSAFISWGNDYQWKSSYFLPTWCIHSWLSYPASHCPLSSCTLWPILVCLSSCFCYSFWMGLTSSQEALLHTLLHLLRGNISLAKLMFRMFTQFHNFMEVCYISLWVGVFMLVCAPWSTIEFVSFNHNSQDTEVLTCPQSFMGPIIVQKPMITSLLSCIILQISWMGFLCKR